MTTIVYHKDILVGDSRYFDGSSKITVPYEKPKIFLSPSKEYAYGIDAEELPTDINNFYITINSYIEKYLTLENEESELELDFPFKDVRVLVMTNEKTFTIHNSSSGNGKQKQKQIVQHSRDSIVAYGSGGPTATISILSGSTITEGLRDAVLNDQNTGGDLYGVKRSVLKGAKLPEITVKQKESNIKINPKLKTEKSDRRWFK